jgi:hypothetical protein
MSKALVIGLDLLVLGLLIAYWEWRYRVEGWGRGWMHEPKHRLLKTYPGYVPPDPFHVNWEFDLPLPESVPEP